MRVGFVEWPEGLRAGDDEWLAIAAAVDAAGLDLLVTNELPFGEWIASRPSFDRAVAQRSVACHADGVIALGALAVREIITSRPVWAGDRLANEAILLRDGVVSPWRRKRYFPDEPGWAETEWYVPGGETFPTAKASGMVTGVLLCTEAMFNERARHYGRSGAALIAVPRATSSSDIWQTAGRMAAIVSGAYVVSSNRRGGIGAGFGGGGFAYAPDGTQLATTMPMQQLAVVEIDPDKAAYQQRVYPCYVME